MDKERKREQDVLLQCIQFIVRNKFFDDGIIEGDEEEEEDDEDEEEGEEDEEDEEEDDEDEEDEEEEDDDEEEDEEDENEEGNKPLVGEGKEGAGDDSLVPY